MPNDATFEAALEILASATGLIIAAGAGMGVDSGLPDFRGTEGFWRAYPALARAGLDFTSIASPQAFAQNPHMAWGFYGHRLALYRRTLPHAGFAILKTFCAALADGYFIFTSNVDGQFQKAGFASERICEVHGSIHRLQCIRPCSAEIWPADGFEPTIDEARCEILSPLPTCPHCRRTARPNILMFDDFAYLGLADDNQYDQLLTWIKTVERPVILELGAGTAIPTVRNFGRASGIPKIRVNPRDYAVDRHDSVGVPMTALEFLSALAMKLRAQ